MNIFPFTLPQRDGDRLFHQYAQANRDRLNEELGEYCIVGTGPALKLWSYYEVKVEVHSETTVVFTTYNLALEEQDVIPHAYALREPLREAITKRKQELARQVYAARQEEAAHLMSEAGVAAVHQELFGE